MFDKLSSNLNKLITTRNISVIQLSQATGVPASTIKKIRNSSNMNPTLATLIPIAHYFSVSLDYLISGNEKKEKPVQEIVKSCKEWPLLSWEEAIYRPCKNSSHQKKVYSIHDHHSQSFAVQVDAIDWSMFPQGTVLIIDPSIRPSHRDYVVVFKEGQLKANIKLLLCEDENKYLQSVCIADDIVPLTSPYKILGVVMEAWRQLSLSKQSDSIIEKEQMVSV